MRLYVFNLPSYFPGYWWDAFAAAAVSPAESTSSRRRLPALGTHTPHSPRPPHPSFIPPLRSLCQLGEPWMHFCHHRFLFTACWGWLDTQTIFSLSLSFCACLFLLLFLPVTAVLLCKWKWFSCRSASFWHRSFQEMTVCSRLISFPTPESRLCSPAWPNFLRKTTTPVHFCRAEAWENTIVEL